jgi:hypothetical protein
LWSVLLLFASPALAQPEFYIVDSKDPGEGPCGITVAERQGVENPFLLVGSHFEDRITSYRIARATGELSKAGTRKLPSGSRPVAVGFAYGRYAVVANQASSDLYTYRMNRNGRFKQIGTPVPTGGLGPVDMVISSAGLVAVTNQGSDELSTFEIDDKGRLEFLDKIVTGSQPAGVSIRGNRIAVANSGSGDVSIFRLNRLRNLKLESTTPLGQPPLDLSFGSGRNLYVATSLPPGQGAPAKLFRLKLKKNDKLKKRGSVTAGIFLSGLTADDEQVYGATVNSDGTNEVKVYDPKLREEAGSILNTGASSMSLSSVRVQDLRYVFLNEFGNSSTSSFRLER